ncbi:MAG: STAS domain-containing protein [Neisseria sp.]|nr:STAS domain-containing protein [Neisseria sp.]
MNSEIRDGVLHLSGDITVKTVQADTCRRFAQDCGGDISAVDLSGVGRADSACLSLLLSLLRRKGRSPELRNLPPSVNALAELYEIRDWFA